MTGDQELLCVSGILLFVLGLLNGAIIPMSKSPRLSLSAHLTAVQSGIFLIAIAWAWPHFGLTDLTSLILAGALAASLFVLWLAFFFAGVWGAGRHLPIAGTGAETGAIRQRIVTALLGTGVAGTMIASAALLISALPTLLN